MVGSIRERLQAARHSRFVGRGEELNFFAALLAHRPPPINILYLHGPGGIGKSALLLEFAQRVTSAGGEAVLLDARSLEPDPDHFLRALCTLIGCPHPDAINDTLASAASLVAILIDTYEQITPLDSWLRESFVPNLPQNVLIVLASRDAPAPAWRADPGLWALTRVIALRNLRPDEARQYLQLRGVPAAQQQAVLAFTHGHPLALSLIADTFAQHENFVFQPEYTPDVVRTLIDNFVQKVPTPDQRSALEVCVLAHLTTEELLAHTLPSADPHALFEWLRGLSFIEKGREGLFPHDLAREAIVTDLRWRNPSGYADLHARIRAYYTAQIGQTSGLRQQQRLFDLIYLHRENPVVRPYFEWGVSAAPLTDTIRGGDITPLVAMVTRHEGAESGWVAKHWLTRWPGGALIWRDSSGMPAGFLLSLPLHEIDPRDAAEDPATMAALRYLNAQAPLRPGERATLFRFWMDREAYQGVSPIQSLIFVNVVRHYLTTPNLAVTLFPVADVNFWAGVFGYASLDRIPSADFTVGGRRYGVYGHDWRVMPTGAWLALLAERETALLSDVPPPVPRRTLTVLSQEDFSEAVREALRNWNQMERQATNPLINSRLVAERAHPEDGDLARAGHLQAILEEALAGLARVPRAEKAYRAVYYTYIQPVPTQEQAAERLDLPFSTYRRHLKTGLEWLIAQLWGLEIGK
jgi:hypothetical protein